MFWDGRDSVTVCGQEHKLLYFGHLKIPCPHIYRVCFLALQSPRSLKWQLPYLCNGEIVKFIGWGHTHSQPEFAKGLLKKNPKGKEEELSPETLPEKYLWHRYLHSCWHCCLCGYSCCVLLPSQTGASDSSYSAKLWTACNIFRYLISISRAGDVLLTGMPTVANVLEFDLVFTSMWKVCWSCMIQNYRFIYLFLLERWL